MLHPRVDAIAVTLKDGRVLVGGGLQDSAPWPSFELFDPSRGTFSAAASTAVERDQFAATVMADGRVLIVGGDGPAGPDLDLAEIYNPTNNTFTQTGSMTTTRISPAAVRLLDGRVLVVGGSKSIGLMVPPWKGELASAEIYDPAKGTFSATGSMHWARANPVATLLKDGRVLVLGGSDDLENPLATAEIFDPATDKFTPTGSMRTARSSHADAFSATYLPDGRVLVAGGVDINSKTLASAEIYDPTTGKWSATGSMTTPRGSPRAVRLADGRVLVLGGELMTESGGVPLSSAEIFDPASGQFSATGSTSVARDGALAVLLQDGRVLVAGGVADTFLSSAEIYQP